jgi:hypothetical protein
MIDINKVLVPTSVGDGKGKLTYKDGKVVCYEHGATASVYLFHEQDDEGQMRAFQLTLDAPLTYDKCINAAEMAAYGLRTAMDVASLAASLARKARTGEDPDEVAEHDSFIGKVKAELAAIGLAS